MDGMCEGLSHKDHDVSVAGTSRAWGNFQIHDSVLLTVVLLCVISP